MLAALIAPVSFGVENTESPATAEGGVIVDSSASGDEAVKNTSGPSTLSRAWSNFVDWFLDVTDLTALSTTSTFYTISHVAMVLFGLVLAIFGARVYSWAFQRRRSMTLQNIAVRVFGIVLIVLAFII